MILVRAISSDLIPASRETLDHPFALGLLELLCFRRRGGPRGLDVNCVENMFRSDSGFRASPSLAAACDVRLKPPRLAFGVDEMLPLAYGMLLTSKPETRTRTVVLPKGGFVGSSDQYLVILFVSSRIRLRRLRRLMMLNL